ncbi:hypothetical protein DVDV_3176 [Desulfovibrio sp. DV]|nr:hypothetical protein DVDV_3176 [Desulfovibrio sp. DV]
MELLPQGLVFQKKQCYERLVWFRQLLMHGENVMIQIIFMPLPTVSSTPQIFLAIRRMVIRKKIKK